MRVLTLFDILMFNRQRYDYAGRGKILKETLHTLSKWVLRTIVIIITLFVAAILFIFIFHFYEESKFINNCMEEGNSREKCQSIWGEIDALD